MDKKKLQTDILERTYQPDEWVEVLKQYFGAKKFHQAPQPITLPVNDLAEKAVELGSFYTADERLIGIYEVNLTNKAWINKNRVGLRNLLRQVYKYDVDGALIVFVQDEKWRFSYVSEIRTEEGKKETEPKRYTYLFGNGESCRTAADRFDKLKDKPIYLNDLFDAFSVEKLNKEFFKSYKEYFELFSDYLAKQIGYRQLLLGSSSELEKGWKDEKAKPIRNFSKRLLGRIVFLQFLQKKGWMGVPATSKDWTNGDPKFLQNLFRTYTNQAHFHSSALRSLFFETLNCKRTNHLAPAIIGENIKIPYLNGGLFDKDISLENDIDFPIDLFKNLLDFFEQYNFTIDENDPYDSEVGIDPEMLGHIFENLLEENREKGAFYTPKEIVHYMCHESLIQYLRTHLPECTEDDSPATKALENFIRNGVTGDRNDKRNFVVQQAKRIEILLDTVKICDPAIGSGAFPMGMLQEIFNAKTALDLTLDHAEVKRQIIQNNIYGVDLEPGAVDIARLRFWLALVVDETEPQPLPNLDYKIMQGNSLLEQFEDISLKFERKVFEVKIIKQVDLFGRVVNPQYTINEYLQTKQHTKEFDITELEEKYFLSNIAEEKQQIREKIENFERQFILEQLNERENKLKELLQYKVNDFEKDLNAVGEAKAEYLSKGKKAKDIEKQKAELEKVRQYRDRLNQIKPGEKPWFLWHLYFMDVFDNGGFDIVIGNPPYIKEYTNRKAFDGYRSTAYYQGKMDIWYGFACVAIDLLKQGGVQCFIAQNNWTTSSGASILRNKVLEETEIKIFTDFGNYKVFETAGIQTMIYVLQKKNPLKKHNLKYSLLLNERINKDQLNSFLLFEKFNDFSRKYFFPLYPIEFKEKPFSFNDNKENYLLDIIKTKGNLYLTEKEVAQGIVFPQDFLNKTNKEVLGDNFKVNEGIFGLSEKEKTELKLISRELELVKPYYTTDEVTRFYCNHKNRFWLIYTASEFKNPEAIKPYPNIKMHLDKFQSIITSDNKPYGLHRARDERFFKGEKIIVQRKCANQPSFSYCDFDCYVSATFYIIKSDRINLKYLTGTLNSRLIEFWLKHRGKMQGNNYQIDKEPIINIPIFNSDENDTFNFEKIVNKIINLKESKLDSTKYENKIDALVFHLYNLTESEMLQVLDSFKDMSIKDRNQIQNEYWNITNNKFQLEA